MHIDVTMKWEVRWEVMPTGWENIQHPHWHVYFTKVGIMLDKAGIWCWPRWDSIVVADELTFEDLLLVLNVAEALLMSFQERCELPHLDLGTLVVYDHHTSD